MKGLASEIAEPHTTHGTRAAGRELRYYLPESQN